jgi:hypothetical protein
MPASGRRLPCNSRSVSTNTSQLYRLPQRLLVKKQAAGRVASETPRTDATRPGVYSAGLAGCRCGDLEGAEDAADGLFCIWAGLAVTGVRIACLTGLPGRSTV